MGETAEPGDDVPVRHRVAGKTVHSCGPGLGRQGGKQLDALVLGRPVLAVLQGEVEEYAVNVGQLAVPAGGDRPPGQCQCPGVTGEGAGGAAVDIAGKLVQQQHQGDQARRRSRPSFQVHRQAPG